MKQESIHPRSYYPNGVKKNTAEPRSRRRLEKALAGIEKHLEVHPHDGASSARAAKIRSELESMPRSQPAKAA